MTRPPAKISRQAAALRKAFDAGFAAPQAPPLTNGTDLLAVRLAGDPWAIPLSTIAGLHADKKITPLPGATPGLLGLAGFRGVLVPVYDLAARLGLAPAPAPRWLVLAKGLNIGLAFAELDGHLRAAAEDMLPPAPSGGPLWTGGFVRVGDDKRPLLHLAAVLDMIPKRKESLLEGSDT